MYGTLHELISAQAYSAIAAQQQDGSWAPGVNGPYGHIEYPVRVTAHRAVLLAWLVDRFKSPEGMRSLALAAAFLSDPQRRPEGWTPLQREARGLDRCNGLIGPAWTIEGLLAASRALNDSALAELALRLVLMHEFNERQGLWSRREVDGRDTGVDTTLNHQIWFCAAAAMTSRATGDPSVRSRVESFLDHLSANMGLHSTGLVRHAMERRWYGTPRVVARVLYGLRSGALLREKAIGYHMFNLYGLALIRENYGDHEIFNCKIVTQAVKAAASKQFVSQLRGNRFGYPYNPPGWEAPFVAMTFSPGDLQWARPLVEEQVRRSVRTEHGLADRDASDAPTLAARIYELSRAPEESLCWKVDQPD